MTQTSRIPVVSSGDGPRDRTPQFVRAPMTVVTLGPLLSVSSGAGI